MIVLSEVKCQSRKCWIKNSKAANRKVLIDGWI